MDTLLCLYNCYTHLKNKYFTGIKKGYLSQTANLFVNLKSNTMKNTLQRYGLSAYLQIFGVKQRIL